MPAGTRVVLLTPPGRAAVASLLVEGPAATSTVSGLFQPAGRRLLAEQPCGRIAFGRWPSSAAGEEVVVCRRSDRQIEIHCHGGRAAVRAIIATLTELGLEEIPWTAWIRQQSVDPLVADARIALASTTTERTALLLWRQHEGALRQAIETVLAQIASGDLASARRSIDELLGWSKLGMHLTVPWRVVLAGRPNVGKSSLINALLGYRRAIVHSTPGTTRDVVTASTAIAGWPIELSDTAGMRTGDEELEKAGIELGHRHAAKADLVLLVFDRSKPWTADDETFAEQWPRSVRVLNKCDLPPGENWRPHGGIHVSALTGSGLDKLATQIARHLVPIEPAPDQALPFLPTHVAALAAAAEALACDDPHAATCALRSWLVAS